MLGDSRLTDDMERTDWAKVNSVFYNAMPSQKHELVAAARHLFTVVGEALIDGDSDSHEIECDITMACERLRVALTPFDDVEV